MRENIETIEITEQEILLPQVGDFLDMDRQYKQIMFLYEAGIDQLMSRLDILRKEFQFSNDRNPIENVKSRVNLKRVLCKRWRKREFRSRLVL